MMDEFKVNRIDDAQVEVEHVAEGHVWTFTVGVNDAGERLLSSALVRSPDHASADKLGGHAWRYAEKQAFAARMIDRSYAP